MKIGILGGGQLGRMLAMAGSSLGVKFRFMDQDSTVCSGDISELIVGDFLDHKTLKAFALDLDIVTFEFENVPTSSLEVLKSFVPVYPAAKALEVTQDRLHEKQLFKKLGVPCARFAEIATEEDLRASISSLGLPAVLKTRRFGYDGKGQFVISDLSSALSAFKTLGGQSLILEEFVDFKRELSVLAVRGRRGESAFYPLTENQHSEGILRVSTAPAENVSDSEIAQARKFAQSILDELDYVGVLAIEFFETDSGFVANEIAPRVHNSGHWTMNGAVTSQFENHIRAVAGYPLGSCEPRGHSAMVNLIGDLPDLHELLKNPDLHVHLYGKKPKPGRKIGHINISCGSRDERDGLLDELKGKIQTTKALSEV